MDRKMFLRPFAASVAVLLASTQAQAATDTGLSASVVAATSDAVPSIDLGLTLAKPEAGVQLASHASHSSHSSHSSHASHSSHSSSSF
ncbi:hypothetical protein OSJ57_18815 [Sphingomonas sp. HH69]